MVHFSRVAFGVLVILAACSRSNTGVQKPSAPTGGGSNSAQVVATPTSCVPDVELTPVQVPPEVRALVQERRCDVIVNKQPRLEDWKDCQDVQQVISDVLAFCKDPLSAVRAVSGREIELARAEVESGAKCKAEPKTVGKQTDFALGLPFQDVVLRGLTSFIVARAKAELMAFLVERIADELCDDRDVKALLPATCEVLSAKPDGNAWGALKAAFEIDLERLPERAIACTASKVGAQEGLQTFLYLAAQAARLVYRGEDPWSVLAGFEQGGYTAEHCNQDRVGCGLHVFGFTVQLLAPRTSDSGEDLFTPQKPDRFAKLVARRWLDHMVELALIGATVREAIAKKEAELRRVQELLVNLQDKAVAFRTTISAARKQLKDAASKPLAERLIIVASMARATIGFLDDTRVLMRDWIAEQFKSDPKTLERLTELDRKVRTGLSTMSNALGAYDNIATQQYAHVYAAVAGAIAALRVAGLGQELDRDFQKYAPFLSEVAAAKKPEDVQRALEAAAAPVGGGLAKRGSARRTVAVTALAGLTGGGELAFPTAGAADLGAQGGLFVPVGVDVSWGLAEMHSLGFFVSAVDLGALASFRTEQTVNGNRLENAPEIGLRQVVSPGVYFVWGIDRVAVGLGASMTPELRKVTSGNEVVDRASALRFGAFLAVDVTIFPF